MKKKIDKVFQERFQNLETAPPQESWENILTALPPENKRKIIPIWYKLAGTAAALALMLSLYNIFLPQEITEGTQYVNKATNNKSLYVNPTSESFPESMSSSSFLFNYTKLESLKSTIKNKAATATGTQNYDTNLVTSETEEEYNSPLTYGAEPKSGDSFMDGEEEIKQKHIEKSSIAENTEDDIPVNKIDLLVQNASEKDKMAKNAIVEKTKIKRLSIRPTAGAVYFDNFGDGNSLDPQFSNNKSSGELTMAYGVNLAYRINRKLNIRTGINKINLSQNTSDIEFGEATLSASLNPQELLTPLLATSNSMNGSLNQSLEYIEIPLELELSLLDNKIGLNIIGGASTFLLNGNMISYNSPTVKTELGEANNLNDLSFSANIGLGLNYKFSPKFQFDLEPIFKYQINAFNKESGFTPYIFGIYSGLTFKF